MKNYINENYKMLSFGCILLVSMTIVVTIGMSYAAVDNNNAIYTRDELSEQYNNLESEIDTLKSDIIEEKKKGNTIKLFINSFTKEAGYYKPILLTNSGNDDNSLFELQESNKVLIKKSGTYQINVYGLATYIQNGSATISVNRNSNAIVSGIETVVSNKQAVITCPYVTKLATDDIIDFTWHSTVGYTINYSIITITYIG